MAATPQNTVVAPQNTVVTAPRAMVTNRPPTAVKRSLPTPPKATSSHAILFVGSTGAGKVLYVTTCMTSVIVIIYLWKLNLVITLL